MRGAKIKSQKVSRESRPARNSPPRLPRGSHTAPGPIPDLQKRGPRRLSVLLRTVSSKCPANQQESPSGVKDFALILDGVQRDGGDT